MQEGAEIILCEEGRKCGFDLFAGELGHLDEDFHQISKCAIAPLVPLDQEYLADMLEEVSVKQVADKRHVF